MKSEETNKLGKNFFERNADAVARDLLGKEIVRETKDGKIMRARIVETEAYFDENDPASRACQNGDLRETMKMDAGTLLVYGIHTNWMLNFVTGKREKAEAVLIRAIEPLNFDLRCSGPGLLTKSLEINKILHKKSLFDLKNFGVEIRKKNKAGFEVIEDFRVGVKEDLPEKMRFYIKGNSFVSRK
ncbi:hypothetical protein GF378_01610 [Candidatus Pacearchaeota archaeon]|nr:hypothetical protein [Candidatus Pacearchaeota archaeon]